MLMEVRLFQSIIVKMQVQIYNGLNWSGEEGGKSVAL